MLPRWELPQEQEAILLADLDQMHDIPRWDPPVPLVLLEGMYRPYTDRLPPLSGIDGDVRDPSTIIWLRNAHADGHVISLAAVGVADTAIHNAESSVEVSVISSPGRSVSPPPDRTDPNMPRL